MTGEVSRRELFSSLFAPFRRGSAGASVAMRPREEGAPAVPEVAIIQGRYCLAYQKSFCSTCVERCPVPDAIVVEQGIPRVNRDVCTGCGICASVCPAPRNAVLMLPRRI